jgi:hypothetical protein
MLGLIITLHNVHRVELLTAIVLIPIIIMMHAVLLIRISFTFQIHKNIEQKIIQKRRETGVGRMRRASRFCCSLLAVNVCF